MGRIIAPVSFACALFSSGASAQQTGDVLFNGVIGESCTLVISSSGTLAPNLTLNQLSSEIAGGARASALVTTTSLNYDLVVDAPVGFTTFPTGGDTSVDYSAVFSAAGVTTLTDVEDDLATSLGLGTTTISVGATADKASGVFPAGSYQLPVTVRCVSS